jgi:hypothetical protein
MAWSVVGAQDRCPIPVTRSIANGGEFGAEPIPVGYMQGLRLLEQVKDGVCQVRVTAGGSELLDDLPLLNKACHAFADAKLGLSQVFLQQGSLRHAQTILALSIAERPDDY